MIKKLPSGKYRLYSKSIKIKTGKRKILGTFDTKKAALKRERQIQYFKHLKKNPNPKNMREDLERQDVAFKINSIILNMLKVISEFKHGVEVPYHRGLIYFSALLAYLNSTDGICEDCDRDYDYCACEGSREKPGFPCEDCSQYRCICDYNIRNKEELIEETIKIIKKIYNQKEIQNLKKDVQIIMEGYWESEREYFKLFLKELNNL